MAHVTRCFARIHDVGVLFDKCLTRVNFCLLFFGQRSRDAQVANLVLRRGDA